MAQAAYGAPFSRTDGVSYASPEEKWKTVSQSEAYDILTNPEAWQTYHSTQDEQQ